MKGFTYDTGDIAIYLTPTEMIELAHGLLGLHLDPNDGGWLEFKNDEKEKDGQYGKVKCQILFDPLRETPHQFDTATFQAVLDEISLLLTTYS